MTLFLIKHHNKKARETVKVKLHAFITSAVVSPTHYAGSTDIGFGSRLNVEGYAENQI